MEFDLSKIELSNNDIRRGIRLPTILTKELAEFMGIMVGDGHLGYYKGRYSNGKKYVTYQIKIACNKREDLYISYIRNLFYSLFGMQLSYIQDGAPGAILLSRDSKAILGFLNTICEIPLNSKTATVSVPNLIKNATPSIICAFLRGLADTDFSLAFKDRTHKGHNYPVLRGSFRSENLIRDLETIFQNLGFIYCVTYNQRRYDKRKAGYNTISSIYLNGRKNFGKWLDLIGFSNPKFQDKVEKWQADGVCPPYYEKAPAETRTRVLLLTKQPL